MSQEAYDKAMEELDQLEKSQSEPDSTLEELSKSLEAELETELEKSEKENGAEPEGADDKDQKGEEKDDKDEDNEDFGKSLDEADDELIKASEAYADLEKAIHTNNASLHEELDALRKSVASLINLNIKQAKVIGMIAKSQPDFSGLQKSIDAMGAAPMVPNKTVLGIGQETGHITNLQKSVSEITELLTKSIQAGKVDARYLGIYGTYKDASMLPEEVRKEIGIGN